MRKREGVTTALYQDTRKGLSDIMTFENRREASCSDKWGKGVLNENGEQQFSSWI